MTHGLTRRGTGARHGCRRRALLALAGGVCVAASACLPRERVNVGCRWAGHTAALAPPGTPARRAHLVEDVRVARDLSIRYADTVAGRPPRSMASWDSARRVCAEASLAEVARRHGVARAELVALTGAREPWVDLLAVFLPMGALFVAASRAAVGRFVSGYAPGKRAGAAAVLALCAPLVAALALNVTQIWGATVETVRLGDEHISSRGAELPASRHGWVVWGAAMGLFVGVAVVSLMRGSIATAVRRPTDR